MKESLGLKKIRIGILHSLTGTMARSERPLVEAAQMAVDEINAKGGIIDHLIEPVIEDGASDERIFADKALSLIEKEKIDMLFGCWTSSSRRVVKQILEKFNAQLWYPIQYEGLEESPNIFYTGSCLNQQIIPAFNWCWDQQWTNYFLLGSDYVFPRAASQLIVAELKHKKGNVTGEEYVPLGQTDFSSVITKIKKQKPDVIFNTLNGDSNISFFRQLYNEGITAETFPTMSVSIAEEEIRDIGECSKGHYACWSYFQTLDSSESRNFIKSFQKRYGEDRVISDPIADAYSQIYMWKQVVETAGSFDVETIRQSAPGQVYKTPLGRVEMQSNNHVSKKAYIGKADKSGQFTIIWDSNELIEPLPWLGVEKLDFPLVHLIRAIMNKYPEEIQLCSEMDKLVKEQTADLELTVAKLNRIIDQVVETIIFIGETRDAYTAGHEVRVSDLSLAIGRELGLDDEKLEAIKIAGLLHDVGKIAIPLEILIKPVPLSEEEMTIIKTHSTVGHKILSRIEFPYPIAEIVLQNHERLDGSGYPFGLMEGDIMMEAKVLAVADTVEAMSSFRPYRPAFTIDIALREISKKAGTLYDKDIVEVCLSLFNKGLFRFQNDNKVA